MDVRLVFYMDCFGSALDLRFLLNGFFFIRLPSTGFSLTHVDEVIDELLTKDYSCDVALPRVQKR